MTVSTDKKIATQKKLFLDELITVGDESQTCKNLGFDSSLILEWTQIDDSFRLKKKRVLEYYSQHLADRISVAALNSLYEVLKNGDRVITHSTTNKEVLDLEGNLQQLQNKTVTSKTNKNAPWAVKAGMQIVLIQRLEANISHSLTNLVNNNVLPENLKEQILQVLDKNDALVQTIFQNNSQQVTINEQMLAEIQATLLGN